MQYAKVHLKFQEIAGYTYSGGPEHAGNCQAQNGGLCLDKQKAKDPYKSRSYHHKYNYWLVTDLDLMRSVPCGRA